jgi:hypothetical protein
MPRKAISIHFVIILVFSLLLAGGCYRNNGCQIDPYPNSRHHGPGPALGRPSDSASDYSYRSSEATARTENINRSYHGTYYGPVEDEVVIAVPPAKKKTAAAKSSGRSNQKSAKKSNASTKSSGVKKQAKPKSSATAKKSGSASKASGTQKTTRQMEPEYDLPTKTVYPSQPTTKTASGSKPTGSKYGAANNCDPCLYKPVRPRREPWPEPGRQSGSVQAASPGTCKPCEEF